MDVSGAVSALEGRSPREFMTLLISDWDSFKPGIEALVAAGDGVPLSSVTLCPSVPRPGQLVCMAGNFIEPGRPAGGLFNAFLKSPASVMPTGSTVEFPSVDLDLPDEVAKFDAEPEFAVVIGKTATKIKAADALDHVFGYTQFMDVSCRGLPGGFFLGKSWHTFAPMGPALVTKDDEGIPDAQNLPMKLWVDDELRHDFSTADMDRRLPQLLEDLTKVTSPTPFRPRKPFGSALKAHALDGR